MTFKAATLHMSLSKGCVLVLIIVLSIDQAAAFLIPYDLTASCNRHHLHIVLKTTLPIIDMSSVLALAAPPGLSPVPFNCLMPFVTCHLSHDHHTVEVIIPLPYPFNSLSYTAFYKIPNTNFRLISCNMASNIATTPRHSTKTSISPHNVQPFTHKTRIPYNVHIFHSTMAPRTIHTWNPNNNIPSLPRTTMLHHVPLPHGPNINPGNKYNIWFNIMCGKLAIQIKLHLGNINVTDVQEIEYGLENNTRWNTYGPPSQLTRCDIRHCRRIGSNTVSIVQQNPPGTQLKLVVYIKGFGHVSPCDNWRRQPYQFTCHGATDSNVIGKNTLCDPITTLHPLIKPTTVPSIRLTPSTQSVNKPFILTTQRPTSKTMGPHFKSSTATTKTTTTAPVSPTTCPVFPLNCPAGCSMFDNNWCALCDLSLCGAAKH